MPLKILSHLGEHSSQWQKHRQGVRELVQVLVVQLLATCVTETLLHTYSMIPFIYQYKGKPRLSKNK